MIFRNLTYLFQSEDYNVYRFLKGAYPKAFLARLEKRKKINWTLKSRLFYGLALFLFLLVNVLVFFLFRSWLFPLIFLFGSFLALPGFFVLVFYLLFPLDFFLKERKLQKARNIIKKSEVIVIGITGSYGKTSAKEILTFLLKEKFTVLVPGENINTALGVADFILVNQASIKNFQIFIVEMGAYKEGDIKKICRLVHPQYSLLTGINQCHLERFGSQEKIIKAKFELAENTKKSSLLNLESVLVRDNYKRFRINDPVVVTKKELSNFEFKKNFQGINFVLNNINYETKLIAEHSLELLALCLKMSEILGVSIQQRQEGIKKINFIKHRLEPIYNAVKDILVIDDSYNGNYNGFISGLAVLQRAKGRKVVITPGISELGKESQKIHQKIGEIYAEKVDFLILIKNSATGFLEEALKRKNFKNYVVFDSAEKAHIALRSLLKKGDTILFQNDLSDNFF